MFHLCLHNAVEVETLCWFQSPCVRVQGRQISSVSSLGVKLGGLHWGRNRTYSELYVPWLGYCWLFWWRYHRTLFCHASFSRCSVWTFQGPQRNNMQGLDNRKLKVHSVHLLAPKRVQAFYDSILPQWCAYQAYHKHDRAMRSIRSSL